MPRRMRTPRRLATLPRVRLVPASFPLMLPTLVEEVPRGPGWLFELKWDGVRVLALREKGRVELWARSGARVTGRYPEIAAALAPLAGGDLALDGEVVALDAEGRPSFERLQRRMHLVRDVARAAAAVPATAYFYDCLALFGRDLRGLALADRKALLRELFPAPAAVRYADHVEGDGAALDGLAARLRPLATERCPFTRGSRPRGPEHHWVRPALVCEVRFTEWTSERLVRHPVYLGLRTDRRPRDVRAEHAATDTPTAVRHEPPPPTTPTTRAP